MRYFFYIAYKGTRYHGWQEQPNANTVQAEINKGLATIFQQGITTVGSGRTDTGVHASKQVFHADIESPLSGEEITHKLNAVLPADIVVNKVVEVTNEAHARFAATSRGYQYKIRFSKSPFAEKEYCFLAKRPNIDKMNEACELLIGKHDFTSFSKVKTDVNSFLCEIYTAKWIEDDDNVEFHVTANRFLRGMVRALVGTLLQVGYDKITMVDFKKIIKSKDRSRAGQSVPPHGLYLCEVRYPENIFIN